jgi:hypothetical protein
MAHHHIGLPLTLSEARTADKAQPSMLRLMKRVGAVELLAQEWLRFDDVQYSLFGLRGVVVLFASDSQGRGVVPHCASMVARECERHGLRFELNGHHYARR